MLKVDNLETAKKEGRAPWTDVVYDFKDMVWYNDGFPVTEGHSLIVPKEATQERIIKCMELARMSIRFGTFFWLSFTIKFSSFNIANKWS